MPNYGWQGSLGWGEETTWGTPVTISKFLEIVSESLTLDAQRQYSNTIRNTRSRQKQLYIATRRGIGGDVNFEFLVLGLGQWIKHALGSVTSAQQGGTAAYLHTFTLTDVLPVGLTLEVERQAQYHTYTGCRVTSLTLEAAVDQILRMTASVVGKDETISASGASPTFPSANELLVFTQGIFKIDTVETSIREFRVTIDNRIRDDDYRLGSMTRASLDARARQVSGSFRMPYEAVAQYQKFRDFTPAALNLKFTGSLISGAYYNALEIELPVVYYTGETPTLRGAEEEIELSVPFEAFRDTLNEITVKLTNTETTI